MFANYYDVRDWIERFIPLAYGKEELGLARIEELFRLLGNPERKFKSIHIAGTSGKGSTAFYTARLLQDTGLKVGLHVSPHLVDIRERMQINGYLMPMAKFLKHFDQIKPVVERIKKEKAELTPSYFEILVAATFQYFAQDKVDWAVVEVGLGGRLDATNVLMPEISVITNIGLDHTEILGNTIEKIAMEKAGIIKPGVPVISGAKGKVLEVIEKVARKNGSKLIKIDTHKNLGDNLLLAKAVLTHLKIEFDENSSVFEAKFAGRFEEIQPHVVLDGAHNPDKAKALIQFLISDFQFSNIKKVVLVIAFKKGKRWRKIVDLLVENLSVSRVIATEFNAVTDTGKFAAVGAREIDEYVRLRHHIPVAEIENSQEAVFEAINRAKKGEIVLVTGSLYLVGEVRTMWELSQF